jgi:hypothetical protein
MNSKFIKFVRYNLVYFVFITFIFLTYFYTFDYHIHAKYNLEDLSRISDKKNGCYITKSDLENNSESSKDSDKNEDGNYHSKSKPDGNYCTYNTIYEFNDVIVYRFKNIIVNIISNKLFSPRCYTMFYNRSSFCKELFSLEDAYYILERKMRI